jgi:3-phytase
VHFLKPSVDKKFLPTVFDLEGIAWLPWGTFMLSSEGDGNQKPRLPPELLEVKKDGTYVRSYDLPNDYLPESSGLQQKGVRNNKAFEGLSASPSGQSVFAALEASLVQDGLKGSVQNGEPVRILKFEMAEAWVFKAKKEYIYRLDGPQKTSATSLSLGAGLSEVLSLNDQTLLVLERSVVADVQSVRFQAKLYLADLSSQAGWDPTLSPEEKKKKIEDQKLSLKKTLVLDFADLVKNKQIESVDNLEGMTWGPTLSDGRRSLLIVSDDNFSKKQKTQFLSFAVDKDFK